MQDIEIYKNSFIIIGAPNTHKSEVARILSKKLGYKLINLDREKHSFFDDFTNYDFKTYQQLEETYGIEKAINYIHKYEMMHLKYILDNIESNVIIDFGNTYTLINNEEILNKIKLFKNIVLLKNENYKSKKEFNMKLNKNKVNNLIKTIEININNKSVKEIVDEILNYNKFKDIL